MKVLFVKDLRGQGKKGEKKEVKTGYANNFLIKNGYAVAVNEQNISQYNKEQEKIKMEDELNRKKAISDKNKMKDLVLSFKVQTGKDDKVFGRISPKQIKDELEKSGYIINKKQVIMNENVSSLGYHDVKINLYKDIDVVIKIKLEK